jgi:hypothetical protein
MKRFIVIACVLAACGKGDKGGGGGGGGGETETVPLGTSGFVVDVPKGTKVDSPMQGFFDLKGHGLPQIRTSHMAIGTLDDEVKQRCEGKTDVQKGTLPGGGYFYTCKGESKMMKGVQTTTVVSQIPIDDHSSLTCDTETDKDPAQVLAICKSIKKK